jgi:hypothetical protein
MHGGPVGGGNSAKQKRRLNRGFVAIQICGFFASCGVIDVERTNARFAPEAAVPAAPNKSDRVGRVLNLR